MRNAREEADEPREPGGPGDPVGEPHERHRLDPRPDHRDGLADEVAAKPRRAKGAEAFRYRHSLAQLAELRAHVGVPGLEFGEPLLHLLDHRGWGALHE